jgi:Right handed beta helix region
MKWRISHLRPSGILGASVLIFASLFSAQLALGQIIPPNRNFPWNPGMMSQGGVPNRTTICATLSPSGGVDSALIQAAINSCPSGQVVMLNPGVFIVNNYVLINSSITLRGSGAGITILSKTNGAAPRLSTIVPGTNGIQTPQNPASYPYDAQPIVIVGPSRWPGPDNSTSQSLTADGVQGAYSVTIANASGAAAGIFVLLDETSGASWQPVPLGFGCADSILPLPCPPYVWQGDRVAWNMHGPEQLYQDDNLNANISGPYDTTPGVLPAAMSWFSRTDRPTNEIKEVASVSGNTITFTSPLAIGYRMSHLAQLTGYTLTGSASTGDSIHVTNAGVENLSMYGGADGELRFEAAANSWAKSVEVTQWIGEGVAIDNSFRIELRDSYIHTGSWPEPGGGGYAISLADGSAEVLIENNIILDTNKEIVMRSSGTGSVVGYNYADDSWDFDTPTWVEVGLNASHMAGPHHVLFEGNYSQNVDSDYVHGNAVGLTFFRNWLSGQRRDFTDQGNVRTVGLEYGSWADSFVGNILGRPGQMSGWNYTDPAMSCDANGNNCTGNNGNWSSAGDIWKLGYDAERWGMVPDPQTLSTVIRDGNYDFLTNSQQWHNTPGGFAIPDSMYLPSIPAFFGSNPAPWTDPATGAIYTLPAKARYDAGTPNQQTYMIALIATATATVACGPPASLTATFSSVNLSAANRYETDVTIALTPNGGPPIVVAGPLTIPANTSGNISIPGGVTGSLPSGVTFTLTGSATLRNDTGNVNANTIPISFTNSNNQITCG